MRCNLDEKVTNDPRVRRLARLMGWHIDFAIGASVRLWIAALNRVNEDNHEGLLTEDDAEDSTDHRGLVAAMVQAGLAERRTGGLLYFAGVRERAEFLLEQRRRGRMGGRPKR